MPITRNTKEPANPFTGRKADDVWKELLSASKPISKEAALEKMRKAAKAQRDEKQSHSRRDD